MGKPWCLNDHLAKIIIVRRASGEAVATIAADLKVTCGVVYAIVNGQSYTDATRSLRWRARKLLNEVKQQRLRDGQSHTDYRIIHSPKKILREAARMCTQEMGETMQEAKAQVLFLKDKRERLLTLNKYL